jgi:hypothetical protein
VSRIQIALVAGLVLIASGIAVTLWHSPLTVARGNSTTAEPIKETDKPANYCQAGEILPRSTSAIRLAVLAALGPKVTLRALSGSEVVTEGTRPAGWVGGSVTVAVRPVSRTLAPVRICFALSQMNGPVQVLGWPTSSRATTSNGRPLSGRVGIEYLRPGRRSWWSLAGATARRLGLGRANSGTWNALLAAALTATFVALSSWLVLEELR